MAQEYTELQKTKHYSLRMSANKCYVTRLRNHEYYTYWEDWNSHYNERVALPEIDIVNINGSPKLRPVFGDPATKSRKAKALMESEVGLECDFLNKVLSMKLYNGEE